MDCEMRREIRGDHIPIDLARDRWPIQLATLCEREDLSREVVSSQHPRKTELQAIVIVCGDRASTVREQPGEFCVRSIVTEHSLEGIHAPRVAHGAAQRLRR